MLKCDENNNTEKIEEYKKPKQKQKKRYSQYKCGILLSMFYAHFKEKKRKRKRKKE